jgi:ParB family chromosome partitioning protein
MAKRKRLEPARLETSRGEAGDPEDRGGLPGDLEVKSIFPTYPLGVAVTRRSPIADVAGDAATMAALQDLTHSLTSARSEGRLIQRLPLDEIDAAYLVRDRIAMDPEEMAALTESLRQRGQQTAIEVADLGEGRATGGRWGLISGWRRLQALRHLQTQTGGTDTVLAIVRAPRDAADAYLAMVEENEIRVGLSYYERARIVARVTDQGVYPQDRAALQALFPTASRSRRSKIGSFLRIVRALDDHLRFPAALNERLGLTLSAALEADPALAARLAAALAGEDAPRTAPRTAAEEAAILQEVLRPRTPDAASDAAPDPASGPPAPLLARAATEGARIKARIELIPEGPDRLVLRGAQVADPAFQDGLRRWIRAYELLHRAD